MPLLLSLGAIALVTLGLRRQVKSWLHRRKVLEQVLRDRDSKKSAARRCDKTAIDLQEIIRNELRPMPSRWYHWIWPIWLAQNLRWYVVIVACGLAVHGVVFGMDLWINSLGGKATLTPGETDRSSYRLIFTMLAVVIVGLDLLGVWFRDAIFQIPYQQRPVAPWTLWKQTQWQGLVRVPTTLLHTLPLLVIPYLLVAPSDRYLPLLTVALSLATLVAVRTVVVLVVVAPPAINALLLRWPAWIGEFNSLVLVFLAMPLLALAANGTLSFDDPPLTVLLYQAALQATTLIFLALATGLWHRTGRLPPIPNDR